MVFNKRIDRERYGPGLFEVLIGSLMGIALGAVIAALHLTFKPVAMVSKPVEPATVGEVYFLQGTRITAKSLQWRRKTQFLTEGGSADLSLSEDELNAWAASATAKVTNKLGVIPAIVTPQLVDFHIRDGVLQVGVVSKFEALEYSQPLVMQARGKFTRGPNGFEFIADELFIGSLPLHMVTGLPQIIIQRAVAAQAIPAELLEAWKKLTLVAVEGDSLHIVVP